MTVGPTSRWRRILFPVRILCGLCTFPKIAHESLLSRASLPATEGVVDMMSKEKKAEGRGDQERSCYDHMGGLITIANAALLVPKKVVVHDFHQPLQPSS